MKWYAVQVGSYDAWDFGSHEFEKAIEMGTKEMKQENAEDFLILTINEETNVCESSIRYSELL